MKPSSNTRWLLGALILVACLAAPAVQTDLSAQGGLEKRVAYLEGLISGILTRLSALENLWQPNAIHVTCGTNTVQSALTAAAQRTGPVTIVIHGVCVEAVTITRDDIELSAAGSGDGLAPIAGSTAVTVIGARRVQLTGVTLGGGNTALEVRRGGQVVVSNGMLAGNAGSGANITDSSIVEFITTVIENNGFYGVFLSNGGGAVFRGGGRVQNNPIGIGLYGFANVDVGDNLLITGNGGGISVRFGSHVTVREALIQGNAEGIAARGGSTIRVGSGTLIQNNQADGIVLEDTSVAAVLGSEAAQIINNGGYGVNCAAAPAVAQIAAGGLGNVSGNARGDVNCQTAPYPQ